MEASAPSRKYLAVLEIAYADIRTIEESLNLDAFEPKEALRRLIEQTFENDDSHVDFVRLVATKNIHYAKPLAEAPSIRQVNLRALEVIDRILASPVVRPTRCRRALPA